MFHALATSAEEDHFADSMSAMIAMAPCTLAKADFTAEGILKSDWKLLDEFPVLLDDSFEGQDNERLKQLCEISSDALCHEVKRHAKTNLETGKQVRAAADTRSILHFLQNNAEGRFQKYSDDYESTRQTELSDLKEINKVPIYLLAPETDEQCQMNIEELEQIPSHRGTTILEGWNHSSFVIPHGPTGKKFFDTFIDILEETSNSEPQFASKEF